MKKILWVSRHAPLSAQIARLQEMFGADCEVVHRDISNSREVAREYKEGGYDDLVCVVPKSTLDHICREGLKPLWAEMVETRPRDGREPDLQFRGKSFWFDRYRRVRGVSLALESVEPKTAACVLCVTRHRATDAELAALRQAFGSEVEIKSRDLPLQRGAQIVLEHMQDARAEEVLLVGPYSVHEQLTQRGVYPLWAEFINGRFVALHRVEGVRIDFEEV